MNNSATILETKLTTFLEQTEWVSKESANIYKTYFATDASTNVSGLPTDATAATVETKITKGEYVGGITLMTELNDFFSNAAVTQGDYIATIENIIYGNDAASSQLSVAVEEVANRMKVLCIQLLSLYQEANIILDIYTDMKISSVMSSLNNEDIFWGTSMSKAFLSSFVTLVEQFKKMLANEAVTQADYQSTISKRPRS